jgi:hypothetical protein
VQSSLPLVQRCRRQSAGTTPAKVHAVLTAPVDPRMTRGLDIPKASPETVAKRIFDGVDDNEHEIFPDATFL